MSQSIIISFRCFFHIIIHNVVLVNVFAFLGVVKEDEMTIASCVRQGQRITSKCHFVNAKGQKFTKSLQNTKIVNFRANNQN